MTNRIAKHPKRTKENGKSDSAFNTESLCVKIMYVYFSNYLCKSLPLFHLPTLKDNLPIRQDILLF